MDSVLFEEQIHFTDLFKRICLQSNRRLQILNYSEFVSLPLATTLASNDDCNYNDDERQDVQGLRIGNRPQFVDPLGAQ